MAMRFVSVLSPNRFNMSNWALGSGLDNASSIFRRSFASKKVSLRGRPVFQLYTCTNSKSPHLIAQKHAETFEGFQGAFQELLSIIGA